MSGFGSQDLGLGIWVSAFGSLDLGIWVSGFESRDMCLGLGLGI